MAGFKKFLQNGGHVKLLLWAILAIITFLSSTVWKASKYDSRLISVETTVINHEEILKAIPPMKEDLATIKNDISWIRKTLKQ